jgi:tetratricopeptide (TPR) repeat protein
VAAPLLVLILALVPGAALAQEHWPPPAEKRFQEALQLQLHGKHAEAAAVYREVADWPEGGEWKERARALYAVASELEAARELERALATYRELVQRFPRSDFVSIANRAAQRLDPTGVSGGLEFQRLHREAWDVLVPAMSLHYRRELDAARPGLEKAEGLLRVLLRDHADHPQAVDVAVALSDVLIRLERLEEARAVALQAVTLAEREATKPGAPNTARGEVMNAERQVGEARRAIFCHRLDLGSKVLLVLLAIGFLRARPWVLATRAFVKLWLALMAFDVVLAGAAIFGAEYVRRRESPDSLLTDLDAALLVLIPGTIGITLALTFVVNYKGRRGAALAALAGVAGALAASICLVQSMGFFTILPEF